MGTGKAAILAFLSFPNLSKVLGIELAESRFRIARDALRRLAAAAAPAGRFRVVEEREKRNEVPIKGASPPSPPPVSSVTLVEDVTERALEIRCGDLFEGVAADELARCEVALLNTCFPASCYSRLGNLLACRLSHPRCRTVLYHDIRHLFAALPLPQAKADTEPEPAPPSSSSSSASSSSLLILPLPRRRRLAWRAPSSSLRVTPVTPTASPRPGRPTLASTSLLPQKAANRHTAHPLRADLLLILLSKKKNQNPQTLKLASQRSLQHAHQTIPTNPPTHTPGGGIEHPEQKWPLYSTSSSSESSDTSFHHNRTRRQSNSKTINHETRVNPVAKRGARATAQADELRHNARRSCARCPTAKPS